MPNETGTKSSHSFFSLTQILLGALIGIPLGIAGVLIYQGYLGQITNILLYVSLVFFGVVVLTFILVWGFKTYLTRLIFGSKVADSPDLIAEAQQMTDQLSSNVIDKLLEKATEEDKEKVKGLVVRLGNWFLWGRLRNWWWSWILGIFVSLGGLTGTLLLVNQNQLIKHQMSLEEASRRGALVMLMSNIFDKVDREIERQRDTMKVVTDNTRFSLSQSLIGQIAALSQAFKPYRFMDGEELIGSPLSPERGQLLVTITRLPLDTITLEKIYAQSTFDRADLSGAHLSSANMKNVFLLGANLKGAYLSGANLSGANLSGANLSICDLSEAKLIKANLIYANLYAAVLTKAHLSRSKLIKANLIRANLSWADLSLANLSGANLLETNLSGANLIGSCLNLAIKLKIEQLAKVYSLFGCIMPESMNIKKLKKAHPSLFEDPWK